MFTGRGNDAVGKSLRMVRGRHVLTDVKLRQLVQHALDVGGALILDLRGVHHGNRTLAGEIRGADATARDEDLLETGGVLRGICGPGERRTRCETHSCTEQSHAEPPEHRHDCFPREFERSSGRARTR